jgi:ketosteroid isomerase-like protein
MAATAAASYGHGRTVQRPKEAPMSTASLTDVDAVRAGFEAFGRGDVAAFAESFHPDATWNHRNPDRLGGVHDGIDAILEFITESGRLTAGTLRAMPETIMYDGAGHVAVVTRVSGSRPDGRMLDDRQVLVFTLEGGRIRAADQYVGDPPAVTAFWA